MKKFHVNCVRYYRGEQDVTVLVEAESADAAEQKALEGSYVEIVEEGMKHEDHNENVDGGAWQLQLFTRAKEVK